MKKEKEKIQKMKEVFAQRLQNIRKICSMSQSELAEKMKELAEDSTIFKAVSSTAIEKYEKGIMFPESSGIIITIAAALNTNPGNLMRPFSVTIDREKFEFRKKSRLGKKAIEGIKLQIAQRIEKYVEVERIAGEEPVFDVDFSNIEVRTAFDAFNVAMKLRKKWELGMGPIVKPIQMLESHGVKVIDVKEDPELFDGTSVMVEGLPVIVLNSNLEPCANEKYQLTPERRNLTLFHELGHMVMHIPADIVGIKRENLCNAFANEMLIPSETFINIFGKKRNGFSLWEMKDVQRDFGISIRALMKKAEMLNVVTQSYYKYYNIRLNSPENAEKRKRMDASEIPLQQSNRYERLVYRCLSSEIITISKAAELLDTSISDILENLKIEYDKSHNC